MRPLAVPLVVALAVAAGCSGSSSGPATTPRPPGDGGGEAGDGAASVEGGSSTPDAFVQATLGASAQAPAPGCPLPAEAPALTLGSEGAVRPDTISSGAPVGSGTASVSCTVRAVGPGFDIALTAALVGVSPASITITSPAGAGAVTAAGASDLAVSFESAAGASYAGQGCTLTYTYQGFPVPVTPAVGAGRIWGHVSCPQATSVGADATAGARCDGEADFLFEACGSS